MGNQWSSSGLKSCQVEEKVELPVGSTRKCLPWQLYRAVSSDTGSGCSLSVFIYALSTESADSDKRHTTRSDIIQAAENNAKWLKRLRHPCIVKFHEVALFTDEVCIVTERVTPLQLVIDSLLPIEICSGLHNIIEALAFLHSAAGTSHNNVNMEAVYVSESGIWKLGSFECARQFDQLSAEFLSTCQPFFSKQTVETDGLHLGCAADLSGFADLAEYTVEYMSLLGDDVQKFQSRMKELLAGAADQQTFCDLLNDELFRNDFIYISCFLKHLPLKSQQEQSEFFTHLVPRLHKLPADVVGSRLTKMLLSRLVVINSAASTHLMPHLLTPATGSAHHGESGSENGDEVEISGIFSRSLYCRYVLPELYKIFHVRDALVRTTLLRHFHRYIDMFDHTTLTQVIMPQLLLSVRDVDDELVVLSLNALATLVPVLGGDLVMGEGRQQLFSRGQPKVGANQPISNGLLHHTRSDLHRHYHYQQRCQRLADGNTRNQQHRRADRQQTAVVHSDDDEHRSVADVTNDARHLAVDSWNDTNTYLTSVDSSSANSTEKLLQSETGRRSADLSPPARLTDSSHSHTLCIDGVNMSRTLTDSSRLSSAMKLKCNVEGQSPPQEHVVAASHKSDSASIHPHSPETSTQDHSLVVEKTSSSSSHPAAVRPSAQSRRTLSNEPLGAEFDVKQIKVRHASNKSASPVGEFDFFADMTPVIVSSAPQNSLLGLLSAAAAELSSTESASRLNISDENHLDSSVLSASAGDGWDDEDVDWDTIDM